MNLWSNWGGNQTFQPMKIVTPANETDAISEIRAAIAQNRAVRVAGAGHSFTPIVQTDGVLLDLSRLSGVISLDKSGHQAEVWGGSKLGALGAPLWADRLSIANQGDVDVQSIAGAVATGTKGSGTAFGSMSPMVTSMRIVNGRGDLVDIDQSDPERLRAAQVSLGLLGPVLRVGLQLVPAYRLREENVILPMTEVLRQWDFLLSE